MSEHDPAPTPAEQIETSERAETTELKARVSELEDQRLRALADLDNVRKRAAWEAGKERERVLGEWLPVIDNLDLVLQHADSDPDALVEGVKVVREQALALLDRFGFPRQDDDQAPFDPARHEAVGTVATTEVPPGTVVQVVRPGYGEGERQLRPATVIVAKAD
ncbi:nucleotide exchange factor GrpE [Nonomuraea sp. NPDC046570]|uniref:nucleotide exchange factor GrpE n=1 Tax=Nonomuraea sp. NPDC046570 TaxID=3155255 RepID=UPI0033E3FF24